jgi:3-hydroxyisobutyrate dehydrogenase-like beta-hydroxyacid dehydrogenase
MDIAFIGLGQMGRPMAINLLKSGSPLVVTSASGKRHAELESKGARATSDHREIAKADIVHLCPPGAKRLG